jgi:hypothetical protein
MVCVPVETTSFSVFMLINANRIGRTAPARMIESSMRVPSTNRIVGAGISTFDGGGSTQARAHAIPRTERKHMFEKIQQHRCATEGVLGCLYNSSTNNGNASTRSISSKLSATTLKVTIRLKLMHARMHACMHSLILHKPLSQQNDIKAEHASTTASNASLREIKFCIVRVAHGIPALTAPSL